MKLITIITILLLISVIFLVYKNRSENFINIDAIRDNTRIVPYDLKLKLDTPLKVNNMTPYKKDFEGKRLDPNILGCDDYRTDFNKFVEFASDIFMPKEYVDKNGNNCDYYRENPGKCKREIALLNSPLFKKKYKTPEGKPGGVQNYRILLQMPVM